MSKKKLKKVSIVIPVFNEEKTIAKIIKQVEKSNTLGLKKEIIIVDDGSNDSTANKVKEITNKEIKFFRLKKNAGKGSALRHGFKKASGDIILIQDADLEYHPKEYPKLLRPFLKGSLVVYGSRELSGKNKHSYKIFHLGGKMLTIMTNLLFNSRLTDEPTGYKVFLKEIIIDIPLKSTGFEFCPEVTGHILKKNIEIQEVPISYKPRHIKEGKKIRAIDGLRAILTLFRVRFGM